MTQNNFDITIENINDVPNTETMTLSELEKILPTLIKFNTNIKGVQIRLSDNGKLQWRYDMEVWK